MRTSKYFFAAALLLFFSFPAIGHAGESHSQYSSKKSFQRGKRYLRKKMYKKALGEFRLLSENGEETPKLHVNLALVYEELASREILSSRRIHYYGKAIEEFQKLPKKDPLYSRKIREATRRIKGKLLLYNNINVKLGDHKDRLIKEYGNPNTVEVSKKYYPKGVVSTYVYDDIGLRFNLKGGVVYKIQVGSNFKGALYGVKIGDGISKVKAIFKGKVVEEDATSAVFASNEIGADFTYSLEDQKIDAIEQNSSELFGEWFQVLK